VIRRRRPKPQSGNRYQVASRLHQTQGAEMANLIDQVAATTNTWYSR